MFSGLRLSGIYQIRNVLNNKIYVGSAVNIEARWRIHISELNLNRHHAKHLQHSYNKYGKDRFVFEILFTCPKEDLIRLEQYHLDNYKPEYNTCKLAGSSLGFRHSEETKKKLSIISKQRILSLETKEKIRLSNLGNKCLSLCKPVLQIHPTTNIIIQEFISIKQAQKTTNIFGIWAVVSNRRPFAGGFKWKYKDV